MGTFNEKFSLGYLKPPMRSAMRVMVSKSTVGADPPIEIHHVELSHDAGVWRETFGSKEQLDAFLTGLRAASGMIGFSLRMHE